MPEVARNAILGFWVTVNDGEYDKVTDCFSEGCIVKFPGWEKVYKGKEACAKFFKKFILEKNVTNTELSFFQGYHPGGEDDGSYNSIVNWIQEDGITKTDSKYSISYCAKFEVDKPSGKINGVEIIMDEKVISQVFG
eukprot:TRINITY_DN16662_c0_g1_i1.p2 TRINITY_DN16662_c0_g1~~TRINITY_DN16662_c0_g1_i1.p2  ORF type:complete len:156 (+),score=65.27 TRINITY_DN16662_c0_g1_i1:59-469(+)